MALYPPALGQALVAGLWAADFNLDNERKAASRADTAYVAGCLFRAVLLCAHALHGRAERWLINEKGAIALAGCLPVAPADFVTRAHGVLAHLGDRPHQLKAAIGAGGLCSRMSAPSSIRPSSGSLSGTASRMPAFNRRVSVVES